MAPADVSSASKPAAGLSRPDVFTVPLAARGVELAVTDWGGDGPVALCVHANGFCGALWQLVAEELAGEIRVVAPDLRGHGRSSAPPPGEAYRWDELATDLVALTQTLGLGVAVGVGNSVGGTSLLGAAATDSSLFGALCLVDPVVLSRERYADQVATTNRLVDAALRRRRRFATRAQVVEAYAGRSLFAAWEPRALELYAEHGFRDGPGGEVELRCAPEVEASVFRNASTLDPFAAAASLAVPGLVLHARDSFRRAAYEELVACAPTLELVDLPADHLAPMTDPALVASFVRASLGSSGVSLTGPPEAP